MSKPSKDKPSKEEIEASMNEYLEKIREFTDGVLTTKTQPDAFMSYVMANAAHVAEMMWVARIEIDKSLALTTQIFKSMYEQFDEAAKEESNEDAK